MNTLDKVSHAAEKKKRWRLRLTILWRGWIKDRTGEYLKLIDLAEKFYGKGFSKRKAMTQRELRYRIQTTNGWNISIVRLMMLIQNSSRRQLWILAMKHSLEVQKQSVKTERNTTVISLGYSFWSNKCLQYALWRMLERYLWT